MKLEKLVRSVVLAVCAAAFLPVEGASYYWDGESVNVDGSAGGGDGLWQVGGPGWEDGSGAVNWVNGNTAVLGGKDGTLSLGGAVSASGITVVESDFVVENAHNVTAGAINIASGASLTLAVGGAVPTWSSLSGGGTLVVNKTGNLDITGVFNSANALNFNGTLRIMGGGWMTIGGGNMTQAEGTAFALDTGPSGNSKELIITEAFNNKPLNLSSLVGYGNFRNDWNSGGPRIIHLNQTINTTFNGTITGNSSARSLHLVKDGAGKLTVQGVFAGHLSVTVTNGTLRLEGNNSSSGLISVGPGAVLDVWNTNASGWFDNGNKNMSANYMVEAGGLIKGIRNGKSAFGTGTITLNGGALAQYDGNWVWTVPIVLVESKSSLIENRSGGAYSRWLKLQGVISGGGDVVFSDVENTMTSHDNGFILTGANTMSGTVTIPINGKLRVGGVPGESSDLAAGAGGSLGVADVVNNGTLTFTRSDELSVAGDISGTGSVRIGSPDLASSDTQVITLTGSNSYSGGTGVTRGGLFVNGAHSGGALYDVGGTLGGIGVISVATRDVTVINEGRVAPGGAPGEGGTLSINKLKLNEGAVIVVDHADDKVVVSESLTLNGNAVELPNEAALNKGVSQPFMVCEGTVSGTLPGRVADSDWYIRRVGNTFYLEYVSGTLIIVK